MRQNPYQSPHEDEPQASNNSTHLREWLLFIAGGGIVLTYVAITLAVMFEVKTNVFEKMKK